MFTFRDSHGHEQTIDGQVWTGLTDAKGNKIFDGDRVHVYIPFLDCWRDGTVYWSFADGEPSSFIVRLDTPYRHRHCLPKLDDILADTHYLEGGPSCYVIPPKKEIAL